MVPGCSAQLEASDQWFLKLIELTLWRGSFKFISTNNEQIKKVGHKRQEVLQLVQLGASDKQCRPNFLAGSRLPWVMVKRGLIALREFHQ